MFNNPTALVYVEFYTLFCTTLSILMQSINNHENSNRAGMPENWLVYTQNNNTPANYTALMTQANKGVFIINTVLLNQDRTFSFPGNS